MADISSLQSVQSNHEKYKDLFKNSGKNDTISTDTFFSLLMAEMSNQDPLEPTSREILTAAVRTLTDSSRTVSRRMTRMTLRSCWGRFRRWTDFYRSD